MSSNKKLDVEEYSEIIPICTFTGAILGMAYSAEGAVLGAIMGMFCGISTVFLGNL